MFFNISFTDSKPVSAETEKRVATPVTDTASEHDRASPTLTQETAKAAVPPPPASQGVVDSEEASISEKERLEEEAAATSIQAAYRGHKTRKAMKESDNNEPTREQLEAEFRADDQGTCLTTP